jgi:hypothetical protein
MGVRCDFCSAAEPAWVYPAASFEMHGAAWGSSGAWTACEDCSALIEGGAWAALAKRCVDNNPTVAPVVAGDRVMRRVAIRSAAVLHRVFAAKRRGARRAFG